MSTFALPPSQIRKEIITIMQAGLVPFVASSPGLGKSSIYRQIAEEFNLEPIDLRLSQCAPEDLMGLPMRDQNKARFAPFVMFPLKGDPLPEGKQGWLLTLDEFNSATKMVQAAAYKLALDRMVGQEDLHESCFVVAAGNLMTDRAIVNPMSTAMQSRLVHLEMVPSLEDFMTYAVKRDLDHRVMGFLEFQPDRLHDFKPDHNDKTFACPRTWEFGSRLIKGKPTSEISLPVLAGTLSEGVAVEFHTFLKEYDNLPKFDDIVEAPTTVSVPGRSSTRFAVTTMILSNTTAKNFADVVQYMLRMSPEFQVIFFRGVVQRDPKMRKHEDYINNIIHLTEFLHGDEPELDAA